MKKKFYLFALAFLGLTLASCGTGSVGLDYDESDLEFDTPWADYSVPVTSVDFELGQDPLTINAPETYEYHYSIQPAKAKKSSLTWTSSNEDVATVRAGKVTGVNAGTALITVSNEKASFTPITLTVNVNVPVTNIGFADQSMDVDYNHQYQLSVVYTPENTNQREVTWSSSNEGLATVDQNGLVTTGTSEGAVVISASSAHIDKVVSITLNVADRTIYPESVTVDTYESRIEIGHNSTFVATAHRTDAQEITDPTVKFYAEPNQQIVSVEEDTGIVHALDVGETYVYAESVSGSVKSVNIPVTVYEVKVTQIHLDEITLSNRNGRSDIGVEFTYDTDTAGATVASIPNFVYESSNENIFTVNANGRMFAVADGDAQLTVRDTRSGKSAPTTVHVKYEADSVSVTGTALLNVGQTSQLTVTTVPAGVPVSYMTFASSDDSVATVNANGLVTAVAEGTATITVTTLGKSAEFEVTVVLPDVPFAAGTVYVVGSAKYATGESLPSPTGGSWDKANQAKAVSETVYNQYALWEKRAIIKFNAGDEWKLRNATTYYDIYGWPQGATYQLGEYKITEGAFAGEHPDMSVNNNGNIEVNRTGVYAIYFAQYSNDHDEGWYSVYVGRHELKISDVTPQVQVNTSVVIEAHDWAGTAESLTFQVTSGAELITVTRGTGDDNYKFTIAAGANTGSAVIVFTDGVNSVTVNVSITQDAPLPHTFDDGWPYIVGNADYHTGTAQGSGSYWGDDAAKGFRALASSETPPQGVFAQYEAEITFAQGNEFQVIIGGTSLYWDASYQTTEGAFATSPAQMSRPSNNVVVNEAGTYKIYIKCLENDGGWQVYIAEKEGGVTPPVLEHPYYLEGNITGWELDESLYFLADNEDSNHFYIADLTLSVGDKIKVYSSATDTFIGNTPGATGDYWVGDADGNLEVTEAGTYYVNFYVEHGEGNHIGLWKEPPTPPEPGEEFTAVVSVDTSTFSGWNPAVSNLSLYVWTADGSTPLGSFASCSGNINSGSVTITSTKTITHFIFYFTQDGATKQTVDLDCSVSESGNYTLDVSNIQWRNVGSEQEPNYKMYNITLTKDGGGETPVDPPEPGEFDNTKVTPIMVIDETNNQFTAYGVDIKLHIFDITFAENSPITTIAGLEAASVSYGESAVTYGESAIDLTMTWVQNGPVKYSVTLPAYIESCKICVYNTNNVWVHQVTVGNPSTIGANSYEFTTTRNNDYKLYLFNNGDPAYNAWIDGSNFNTPLSLVTTAL